MLKDAIIISGKDGADAKVYLEKQVQEALIKIKNTKIGE
jgi:hypothetical protein